VDPAAAVAPPARGAAGRAAGARHLRFHQSSLGSPGARGLEAQPVASHMPPARFRRAGARRNGLPNSGTSHSETRDTADSAPALANGREQPKSKQRAGSRPLARRLLVEPRKWTRRFFQHGTRRRRLRQRLGRLG
jgi:hypothetical protein